MQNRLLTFAATAASLLGEPEVDLHSSDYFDWLSVEQRWLVLPLLHGFDSGRGKIRIGIGHAHHVVHRPVLADHGAKNDGPFAALSPRFPRIRGSRRFLIGSSLQPSELGKIAVIVWTSMLIVKKGDTL